MSFDSAFHTQSSNFHSLIFGKTACSSMTTTRKFGRFSLCTYIMAKGVAAAIGICGKNSIERKLKSRKCAREENHEDK